MYIVYKTEFGRLKNEFPSVFVVCTRVWGREIESRKWQRFKLRLATRSQSYDIRIYYYTQRQRCNRLDRFLKTRRK
jgi:hypothetical protein